MREIEISQIDINTHIDPIDDTYWWTSHLTVRQMEMALRRAKAIPFYYGFSDFDYSYNLCIFKPWPFYYKDSKRIRRRQRRQRLGRWLFKIATKLKE